MEKTGKQPVLFWPALAVTGFLVNFCWESLHGLLYEAHPAMAAAAYGVEYVSLSLLHLWQYGPAMPLVLGVGLFPLLQLSLTGLFSVIAARAIAVKC